MASGMGRRFGGNKLTASFGGRPMIERILETVDGVCSKTVAVTRHTDVYKICVRSCVPVILHQLPLRSDTIRLGLQAVMHGAKGCMFSPGDQPLITRGSLKRLTDAFCEDPESIWRLGDGMPVIFPAWTFDELLHLPDGSGGNAVIRQHPKAVRSVKPENSWELLDADTPEQLALLEQYILER